ncbi:hypothetical protein M0D69_31380 [Caballeronia sp. SEWSISQ10-4 2]|uniref:hypothetical protein n=1 Tax=Caballeronia sp. SEWSISQ10-4 2 TaxID=2937438 RepID=UPI0026546EB7|nr:hypothetical protein [Caballeronia sp. SEWSISQ10-4 2]MDN7182442.1 hypothetical protein [Caballeronia sp. SEWSISQ10-4 2]
MNYQNVLLEAEIRRELGTEQPRSNHRALKLTLFPHFRHFRYCRLDASFFSFFASFFSFGDLTATFFSVFFASWLLLMMGSVVDLTLLPEPPRFGT